MTRLKNKDVEWDDFDPRKYVAANYIHILPADKEVLKYIVEFYRAVPPVGNYLEIGGGPNLYPTLAALPYVDHVDFIEYGLQNVRYLKKFIQGGLDDTWKQWVNLLKKIDPVYKSIDFDKELKEKVKVWQGDIFDLPENKYDSASMQFVSESITQDREEFEDANKKFLKSLKPGGVFIATFMENSQGYTTPGKYFPAVMVRTEEIEKSLKRFSSDVRIKGISSIVRAGHTGMLMASGHRFLREQLVSLEYSHIDLNTDWSNELKRANDYTPGILYGLADKKIQKCIMIGDLRGKIEVDKGFIKSLIKNLTVKPDCVYLESSFIDIAEQILEKLDKSNINMSREQNDKEERIWLRRIKDRYNSTTDFLLSWKKARGKVNFSCPTLVAASYLYRLGYIKNYKIEPVFGEVMQTGRIVNILSSIYLQVEANSKTILDATYPEASKKVNWYFY